MIDIEEFIILEKGITTADDSILDGHRESIRRRWEFGKALFARREGKQLPNGLLDALVSEVGCSRAELKWRVQFAEQYPTEDEVATALATWPSWTQVKKNLPKPKTKPAQSKSKVSAPTANPKRDEMVERAEQGKSVNQIAKETGVPRDTVRRELEREAIEREAAPVDWDTIPGNQAEKLAAAKRSSRKELEREFRTRLLAEVDQYKAQTDRDLADYKAKLNAEAEIERAARNAERERYKIGLASIRAKGVIALSDYKLIRSCLHPDSRESVSDEKLAAAFRIFNDPKIEMLLVKAEKK